MISREEAQEAFYFLHGVDTGGQPVVLGQLPAVETILSLYERIDNLESDRLQQSAPVVLQTVVYTGGS